MQSFFNFSPLGLLFSAELFLFVVTRQPRPEHNRTCATCGRQRPFWRKSGACNRTCAAIARLKEAA